MDTTLWLLAGLALAAGTTAWQISARRRAAGAAGNPIGLAMRRFGVTPADAEAAGQEAALARAQQRCGACALQQECRRRLGALRADVPQACPNVRLFRRIAHERARLQLSSTRRRGTPAAWQSPPRT